MLVGRAAECAALVRRHRQAESGDGSALVLRGAPGVGKSALLEWFAEYVAPARVVRINCVPEDTGRACSILSAIVRALAATHAELLADQAAALRGVIGSGPPTGADAIGLGSALLVLFDAASRDLPLLVLVDDAHWIDPSSLDVLQLAASRLEHERVVLVFAETDEVPNPFDALIPVLEVSGLAPLDAAALLDDLVETRVAESLAFATGGNALALRAIAAQLTPAQCRGDEPLGPVLPIGEVLRRRFRARIDRLSETRRRTLLLAATDAHLDAPTLKRAGRESEIESGAVEALVEEGLLQVSPAGALRFGHPLVRETVYQSAPDDERRAAHRAVAAALVSPADVDRRARHLAAASVGPDERAAASLEAASEVARVRGDRAVAGDALLRAALLSVDPASRLRRSLAAGSAFEEVGDQARALEAFDVALRAADGDRVARADVELRRAVPILEVRGAGGLADRLMTIADGVRDLDPQLARVIRTRASSVAVLAGDSRLAREVLGAESQISLVERTSLAVARALAGDLADLEAFAEDPGRVLEAATSGAGHPDGLAVALPWLGEYSVASRLASALVRRDREAATGGRLAAALVARANLYCRTGRWAAAATDAREALELTATLNRPSTRVWALLTFARIQVATGRHDDAASGVAEATVAADRLGFGSLRRTVSAVEGFRLLSEGRPAEAVTVLEVLPGWASRDGLRLLAAALWAPDLVEAYVRSGALDSAAEFVELLASWGPERQGAPGAALFLRCRGLAARGAARGEAFEQALAAHGEAGMPFEKARTQLCYGEWLRRERRIADAQRLLEAATSGFGALGATVWQERAASEIAACVHGRTAPVPVGRAPVLTPQEYRVAFAVAAGATSREAAAALFLSPRTVEYHLAKIYRKLGLRSRAELVRLVASDPESVPGPV